MIHVEHDERLDRDVLVATTDAGVVGRWPVAVWEHEDFEPLRSRRVRLDFENRWCLSIIWGGSTYSSNHDYHGPLPGWRDEADRPFIERPTTVEVGVILPEIITVPSSIDAETAEAMVSRWPAVHSDPAEAKAWLLEDRELHLWGDPLGYVDAAGLVVVVAVVARLPSHPEREVLIEPEPEFHDPASLRAEAARRFGGAIE